MSSLSHSASPSVVVVVGVRGFSMPLWGGGGSAAAAAAGAGGGSRSKKDEEEVEKRSTPSFLILLLLVAFSRNGLNVQASFLDGLCGGATQSVCEFFS